MLAQDRRIRHNFNVRIVPAASCCWRLASSKKSDEQIAAEQQKKKNEENAYKDALKKIPDHRSTKKTRGETYAK